jgi:hypothetical protein
MKYEVIISAKLKTVWDADNEQQAIEMAEEWTAQEYGDLAHKSEYEVTK